jgi:hypothetical protein
MNTLAASALLLTCLIFPINYLPSASASSDKDAQVKASLDPDAGTLVIESNIPEIDLFINQQKHTMPVRAQVLAIALPPNTYVVRAARRGYADYGPVQVSVAKDAATMLNIELRPEVDPADLEIPGAMPGTQVSGENLNKVLGQLIEQSDWEAVHKDNKAEISAYLEKHPQGAHSGAALQLMADFERKSKTAELARADETAWKSVKLTDRNSLENYLGQFPAGMHKLEANRAVVALQTSAEAAAILTVLRRYANAWSTKDLDSIVALQQNLNRRTVKEELSPIKSIVMKLSPASPPLVRGERATVVCRRQVNEVFLNGIQKQSPEQLVTFVLAKQNGTWTIESTH